MWITLARSHWRRSHAHVARCERKAESSQALNSADPHRGRGRTAARRLIFTVLMKPIGVSRCLLTPLRWSDSVAAPSKDGAGFTHRRIWLVITPRWAPAVAHYRRREMACEPNGAFKLGAREPCPRTGPRPGDTFHHPMAVVAAPPRSVADHASTARIIRRPFTPGEIWSVGVTSLEEPSGSGSLASAIRQITGCPSAAWMAANADNAERLAITTQRFFQHPGPRNSWKSISLRRRN